MPGTHQAINLYLQINEFYKDTKANIEALTGVTAGSWAFATNTNEVGYYDGAAAAWKWLPIGGDITGIFKLSGDITPPTITGTQNDYNPTGLSTATVLRLNADNDRSITGISGGSDGRILILYNINSGSNLITLEDEDSSSTAENRFAFLEDVILIPDEAVIIQYDSTSQRWRLLGKPPRLDEYYQDLIGAMVSGNTETGITVTYDDTNGKLNFVIAFNDGEGDPAAIGTAADGTSAYAARRDHVHAITNSESVLGSDFNITGTAGTFQDTGLSITLPDAGTYEITCDVRAALRANGGAGSTAWWISIELYNSTDSAVVTDSERLAVLTGTNAVLFQMTCPLTKKVTVAASKTIKLYAARNGNGTPAWTTTDIVSNSAGRTMISYKKIG